MGCYNGEGCISGLPIQYGDPIGGIICMSTRYEDTEIITPIWPIIWGEYDDYGGIEPSGAIDSNLIKILGNRTNLLKDLERVTHGCRHQIEDGLPENICLILEHKSVLSTLIVDGNTHEIEHSYKAGHCRYLLNWQPKDFIELETGNNIYKRNCCYAENRIFLSLFRKCYTDTTLPIDLYQSYFESVALYESLLRNSIFLKWQRFAGWQEPTRDSSIWRHLTKVYKDIANNKF